MAIFPNGQFGLKSIGKIMPKYSYCESAHAGSMSRWHIRKLSDKGQKFGGGIDTPSLCGKLTPRISGWDLQAEIHPRTLATACPDCERAYYKELADEEAKVP